MPLYEYQCQVCNTRIERIEKASSPSDGVCLSCGGVTHRLLGAPALKFKGSGWYVNDYGKGNGNGNDSKPTDKTETKHEAKTETSIATKTPKKDHAAPKTDSKVA
jgi:putative FmdB family regulatory protein